MYKKYLYVLIDRPFSEKVYVVELATVIWPAYGKTL